MFEDKPQMCYEKRGEIQIRSEGNTFSEDGTAAINLQTSFDQKLNKQSALEQTNN